MPATVKDIAAHLGLSVSTVTSVLGNRGKFRDTTRRRVLAGAAELGYRPSTAARATRTGRYGAVGLLLSDVYLRSMLSDRLLDGIQRALADRGLRLTVGRLSDERLGNSGFVSSLLDAWSVDGLLINYNAFVPATLETFVSRSGLPAVWVNARNASCCVHPDDLEGGRMAAQRMIDLGHRRIAFVNFGGWDHFSAVDRRDGVIAAVTRAGGRPLVVQGEIPLAADRIQRAVEVLSAPDRPTAIVAQNSEMAWAFYRAATDRLGWVVPRQLSLATFDDRRVGFADVTMDTVQLDLTHMGELAVSRLLSLLGHPHMPCFGTDEAVRSDLVPGNLSAPLDA